MKIYLEQESSVDFEPGNFVGMKAWANITKLAILDALPGAESLSVVVRI